MDEILKSIITGFPSFAGLVLLSYVLWRQNEKLLAVLIDEVRELRQEIADLKKAIQNFSFPTRQ